MRIRSIALRRVLPVCALLLIAGILVNRSCQPGGITAPTRESPHSARAKERETERTRLSKWSSRFAEKKAPPAEITRDAATTPGQLANGLRYILAPDPAEGGEVSLRFLVLAGSMHEADDERGLAHFVEHLAFMGRRSRPDGHTLDEFQRLGLTSGADANAHTTFDHTLYKLDLPLADEAALEEAFRFLRDTADGLLFRQEDVDSEGRVVLRELDEREEEAEPLQLCAAAMFPAVPAVKRSPGGSKEVVGRATPAQLRGFWQRNYLSTRMVLAVAGDFEPGAMEARLRRHFDSLPRQESPPAAAPGDPLQPSGRQLLFVPHGSGKETYITIAVPHPTGDRSG